jgi:hypothetical protein
MYMCVTYLRVFPCIELYYRATLNFTQRRRRGKITITLFVLVHRHSGATATMASHHVAVGGTVGAMMGGGGFPTQAAYTHRVEQAHGGTHAGTQSRRYVDCAWQ